MSFDTSVALAILRGARFPQYIEQTVNTIGTGAPSYTGAPTSGSAGCYLEHALEASLVAQLREDVARRTCRLTLNALVDAQTWTVYISGNAVAYVAGAGEDYADVIAGLIAALPGVAAAAALVTFVAEDADGDGIDDTLVVKGIDEAAYGIDHAATGGAAFDCLAEAESCDARLFLLPKSVSGGIRATVQNVSTTAPTAWVVPGNYEWALTYRGLIEPVEVALADRGYLELDGFTGHAGDGAGGGGGIITYIGSARVWWGPCVEEG